MENSDFLEVHKKGMEVLGFWDEQFKETIIKSIEAQYKPEVLEEWKITDIAVSGDKVLLKWTRRYKF